jgi:hypothetical protein
MFPLLRTLDPQAGSFLAVLEERCQHVLGDRFGTHAAPVLTLGHFDTQGG